MSVHGLPVLHTGLCWILGLVGHPSRRNQVAIAQALSPAAVPHQAACGRCAAHVAVLTVRVMTQGQTPRVHMASSSVFQGLRRGLRGGYGVAGGTEGATEVATEVPTGTTPAGERGLLQVSQPPAGAAPGPEGTGYAGHAGHGGRHPAACMRAHACGQHGGSQRRAIRPRCCAPGGYEGPVAPTATAPDHRCGASVTARGQVAMASPGPHSAAHLEDTYGGASYDSYGGRPPSRPPWRPSVRASRGLPWWPRYGPWPL